MNARMLRIGMIGIGGMGHAHLETIRTFHHAGRCRFVAIADPTAVRFPDALAALDWESVAHYDDYRNLIARNDIDAVIISTPIHLHARQTIDSLTAGKHVYLEKPPCATTGEYEQLDAARRASGKICAIGFQMQAAPVYRFIKEIVASGKIGDLTHIWAAASWPRDDSYYARTSWSGRMTVGGAPVFDGPATNACAHAVHAAMVIAGAPVRVRGSLKRARPIESYDTAFVEAESETGINVRLFLTHASTKEYGPRMYFRGTCGHAWFDWNMNAAVTQDGGETVQYAFPYQPMMAIMTDFFDAIEQSGEPATSLCDTLPYLQTVNGALKSGDGITSFAASLVSAVTPNTPQQTYVVAGLDDEVAAFATDPSAVPSLVYPGKWVGVGEIDPAPVQLR